MMMEQQKKAVLSDPEENQAKLDFLDAIKKLPEEVQDRFKSLLMVQVKIQAPLTLV